MNVTKLERLVVASIYAWALTPAANAFAETPPAAPPVSGPNPPVLEGKRELLALVYLVPVDSKASYARNSEIQSLVQKALSGKTE